jgi:hypothetical protein
MNRIIPGGKSHFGSERLSALLRPMIEAVEHEWESVAFQIPEIRRKQLLRELHKAMAELAEWEEGYR